MHTTNQTPVITVVAYKGGAGKTATAVNTAAAIAIPRPAIPEGRRVLLIDTDQQTNAVQATGADLSASPPDLSLALIAALSDAEDLAELARLGAASTTVPGLSLLAGGDSLAAQMATLGATDPELQRQAMASVIAAYAPYYDAIVVDTPASVTELTVGAILAADALLAVVDGEDGHAVDSLDGLDRLVAPHLAVLPPVMLVAQKFWPQRGHSRSLLQITGEVFPMLERGEVILAERNGARARGPWIGLVRADQFIRDGALTGHPVCAGPKAGRTAPAELTALALETYEIATDVATGQARA